MADLNEPKKETVRITLPQRTASRPTAPVEKETARINLPNRPPGPSAGAKPLATDLHPPSSAPVRPPPPLVAPKPLPPTGGASSRRPPVPPPPAAKAPVPPPPPAPLAPVAPAPPKPAFPPANTPFENRGVAQAGPRKETARIADSPMKATVKLGSAQPFGTPSAPVIRSATPTVANPLPQRLVETVPTQLCWVLVGISALILLIQLWTYFA